MQGVINENSMNFIEGSISEAKQLLHSIQRRNGNVGAREISSHEQQRCQPRLRKRVRKTVSVIEPRSVLSPPELLVGAYADYHLFFIHRHYRDSGLYDEKLKKVKLRWSVARRKNDSGLSQRRRRDAWFVIPGNRPHELLRAGLSGKHRDQSRRIDDNHDGIPFES